MKLDWFDFWLLFSGFLFLILLFGFFVRFLYWFKFKKDLSYIKQNKVNDIVNNGNPKSVFLNEKSKEILSFKKEMDSLMKDVFFDSYDMGFEKSDLFGSSLNFNLEDGLDKLLDSKILDIIKEKEYLLNQKDSVIGSLKDKNHKILKDVINKFYFILLEKDKILRQKDSLIDNLKTKIKESSIVDFDFYCNNNLTKGCNTQEDVGNNSIEENDFYDKKDLINVNCFEKK